LEEREFNENEDLQFSQDKPNNQQEPNIDEKSQRINDDQDENEQEEEEIPIEQNDEWRTKNKHVFVLSEAGKPIYTL
jgi:hypothetical protein